jgi:uncharacterized protein YkwD
MNRRLAVMTALSLFASGAAHAQSTSLDAEQSAFLTLINNYRAQNGVGPLQVSLALQQSSQWMSNDMATKNYFSHTDSLGRNPFQRMAAFGYSYTPAGENIAAGYSDAQSTFTQWQNACDPDASGVCTYAHRQNMLNASYKVMGIGRAYNAAATYRWYWTTDFGGYVDATLSSTSSAAPAQAINAFSATPQTITAGQSVTLSWSVSGATSISLNNGIGDVTYLTSKAVTPTATTTYTLTAKNANGSTTKSITVTVGATSGASYSMWPATATPAGYIATGAALELGVKFRSDSAGKIAAIRFYKTSTNTGVHTGSLWTSDGRLLATGTFTNETASGWQTLTFATPVAIAANTTYIASYHCATGNAAAGYELQTGQNNPPLHALQTGVDGYNGVYVFGPGGVFPSQGTSGYNFWVDVVFKY